MYADTLSGVAGSARAACVGPGAELFPIGPISAERALRLAPPRKLARLIELGRNNVRPVANGSVDGGVRRVHAATATTRADSPARAMSQSQACCASDAAVMMIATVTLRCTSR